MEPRDHQRLVAVWQPGSGIAVHNVKCGVFHLFVCSFHNPILASIVAQRGPKQRGPRSSTDGATSDVSEDAVDEVDEVDSYEAFLSLPLPPT